MESIYHICMAASVFGGTEDFAAADWNHALCCCKGKEMYSGLTKTSTVASLFSFKENDFLGVLKHQVNRFRTICTVCGFAALS